MTLREVLRSMARRWYVVALLVGVAIAGSVFLLRDGGLYATRTVVIFTLPGQPVLQPDNGAADASLISFASAVATELNDGRTPLTYATAEAPFYGAGVREGVSVGLANSGGQWSTSFSRAEIEIQVVGRTEQWVRDRQAAVLAQVEQIATGQQFDVGASDAAQVSTTVAPLTGQIEHVEAGRSAVIVAFAAMGVAALLVGGWLAVVFDRGLSRTRRRGYGHPARVAG